MSPSNLFLLIGIIMISIGAIVAFKQGNYYGVAIGVGLIIFFIFIGRKIRLSAEKEEATTQ